MRLDLLSEAFDGGDIAHGTTNVDINPPLRGLLASLRPGALAHLSIGRDELRLATPEASEAERPVAMPERWLRALGSAQELTSGLRLVGELPSLPARQFVATLPSTAGRSGLWTAGLRGLRPAGRPGPAVFHAEGLNRLGAAKRFVTLLSGLRVYASELGASAWEFTIPGGRLIFTLTPQAFRAFSGEGALLEKLAGSTLDDAALIRALLAFEPRIDVECLARDAALPAERVSAALAVLAVDGRVGFDLAEDAYFHRELPSDDSRIERANPRLVAARRLVADGAIRPFGNDTDEHTYRVAGSGGDHVVRFGGRDRSCTCEWWQRHPGDRGPCKHLLAAQLLTDNPRGED